MKKLILFILVIMSVSCNKQDELTVETNDDSSLDQNQAVLQLVRDFAVKVNGAKSRTSSNLKFLSVETTKIPCSTGSNSRSTNDGVDVSVIKLTTDGTNEGFAVASSDYRVNQVLAYVEKGSVSDTCYNEGMRMFFENISDICVSEVESYESGEKSSNSRSYVESVTVNNFVTTHWGQNYPYNKSCPVYNGVLTVAGCGPIALAQAIAYYGSKNALSPSQHNYPYAEMTASPKAYSWAPITNDIANFIYDVGVTTGAKYGTKETSTASKNFENTLQQFGVKNTYRRIDNIDKWRLWQSISTKNVVIATGYTKKRHRGDGHAWIYSGAIVTMRDNSIERIDALYANWGWNDEGDGWYYGNWENPRIQRDISFKNNNEQVYINQNL